MSQPGAFPLTGAATLRRAPNPETRIGTAKAEPLPLVIRTAADVRALRSAPRGVRRLPRDGPVVEIVALDEVARHRFRRDIRAYIRACGCGAGASVFLAAVIADLAWIAHFSMAGAWSATITALVAGLPIALILTFAAKVAALGVSRWRFDRQCAGVLDKLSRHEAAENNQ